MSQTSVKLSPIVSSLTLGDLKSRMARTFEDSSARFAAKVVDAANEVLRDLRSRFDWSWMKGSDSIELEPGIAEYPLPANAETLLSDPTIAGHGPVVRIAARLLRSYAARVSETELDVPRVCAITGENTLTVWPTPTTALTMLVDFELAVADLVDDLDTLPVPKHLEHVVIKGVRALLATNDGNDVTETRAALMGYEDAISRAILKDIDGESNTFTTEDFDAGDAL